MATGVGPTANTNAVKNALKTCKKNPCECLADAIDRLVDGHTEPGQKPNKGIMERITGMLSNSADPPGTMFNGKDTWATHTEQLEQRQRGLNNLLDEYDAQGCGGGGGRAVNTAKARAAAGAKIPTPEDYWNKFPGSKPAEGPGMLKRIGYGLLGTGLLVGAAALVFVPVDGPFGEYAAGAAGFGAWGLATQ
jgi:hypothetical protein